MFYEDQFLNVDTLKYMQDTRSVWKVKIFNLHPNLESKEGFEYCVRLTKKCYIELLSSKWT